MKHFLIYTNDSKDKNLELTRQIREYLEKREQRVTVYRELSPDNREQIAQADCMLVLGGDGTVLQAVRDTGNRDIPLIGINLGNLGFLTEIEKSGVYEALDRLIAGEYTIESRMMLDGCIIDGQSNAKHEKALNDIVISRNGPLQIVRLKIYVNGKFLHEYSGDGAIVTTPTGSTGYNLSAGGPLVEPNASLLMLTPICPHILNQRSIIFSPQDVIEIMIPEGKDGKIQKLGASFDGVSIFELQSGEGIRIEKSVLQTRFIRLNQVSFLETLNKKMNE